MSTTVRGRQRPHRAQRSASRGSEDMSTNMRMPQRRVARADNS